MNFNAENRTPCDRIDENLRGLLENGASCGCQGRTERSSCGCGSTAVPGRTAVASCSGSHSTRRSTNRNGSDRSNSPCGCNNRSQSRTASASACGCSRNDAAARSTQNGCGCRAATAEQTARNCTCGNQRSGRRGNSCNMRRAELDDAGLPLAMVYAPMQKWREVHDPHAGLNNGTIFHELEFPFYPTGCRKRGCR